MTMTDPTVDALKRLVHELGGYPELASIIDCHPQSLYQICTGKTSGNGKPKGVGRQIREKLTRAFPDWLNPPAESDGAEQAQSLTLDKYTVAGYRLDWETVLATETLPHTFTASVPDDALAPNIAKGEILFFTSTDQLPEPGMALLVQTQDGKRYLRRYLQAADGWTAAARSDAYLSLHSVHDGLKVVAVVSGRIGPVRG